MVPQITVHLLDSAQGHPLQTWTFENRESVTLGRSPENDIVVTDPYVSRSHAYLKFDRSQWRLMAISRQMIFHEGRTWPEVPVYDGTVCRLGPHGCYLRFVQADAQQNEQATISGSGISIPNLKLDRARMEQEVSQIADEPYFQRLKDAMRQRREQQQLEETRP